MRSAVYTCKFLSRIPGPEIVQVLKKIHALNIQHNISGCLIHHDDEFLQIILGKFTDVFQLYSVNGVDARLRYGEPLFVEKKISFQRCITYIISESLYNMPGAADIPILNYDDVDKVRLILGNHTLALNFFWKCFDEIKSQKGL